MVAYQCLRGYAYGAGGSNAAQSASTPLEKEDWKMFRIEFFVEDRNLAATLRGIAGLAKGTPNVQPVVEVPARANGDILGLLSAYMAKHPGTIDANYLRTFQQSVGRSPHGYNNLLFRATEAKLLKRGRKQGNGYVYDRVGAK